MDILPVMQQQLLFPLLLALAELAVLCDADFMLLHTYMTAAAALIEGSDVLTVGGLLPGHTDCAAYSSAVLQQLCEPILLLLAPAVTQQLQVLAERQHVVCKPLLLDGVDMLSCSA